MNFVLKQASRFLVGYEYKYMRSKNHGYLPWERQSI